MSGPRIIALTGPARGGKSRSAGVLGRILRDYHNVEEVGFADVLKWVCGNMFVDADFETADGKLAEVVPGVTGRMVLERIGAVARAINPAVFIRALERRIENLEPDYAIITDLRYPNEADWVHGRGGIVVQTLRAPVPGPNGGDPTHSSQQPLPDDLVDHVLDNTQEDARTADDWRRILNFRGWL